MTPLEIYRASDGDATMGLYKRLEALGPAGVVATNVFRAMKNSGRAKQYRGGIRGKGKYRHMAYDRKAWAMNNLCEALREHGEKLGIRWGWGEDPTAIGYEHVLYVELPTGQVSFHNSHRGAGPAFSGGWDKAVGVGPIRISKWCDQLLEGVTA